MVRTTLVNGCSRTPLRYRPRQPRPSPLHATAAGGTSSRYFRDEAAAARGWLLVSAYRATRMAAGERIAVPEAIRTKEAKDREAGLKHRWKTRQSRIGAQGHDTGAGDNAGAPKTSDRDLERKIGPGCAQAGMSARQCRVDGIPFVGRRRLALPSCRGPRSGEGFRVSGDREVTLLACLCEPDTSAPASDAGIPSARRTRFSRPQATSRWPSRCKGWISSAARDERPATDGFQASTSNLRRERRCRQRIRAADSLKRSRPRNHLHTPDVLGPVWR